MVVYGCLIETQGCFSVNEGNSTNTCIHPFSFFLAEHREPQSIPTHNTNRHCRVRFYAFVGQA